MFEGGKERSADFADSEKIGMFILNSVYQSERTRWLAGPLNASLADDLARSAAPTQNCNSIELWNHLDSIGMETTPKQKQKIGLLVGLPDLFKTYHIKGLCLDSQMGILGWLLGVYDLELLDHIPTPEKMLDAQCAGKRYVSLLSSVKEEDPSLGRHKNSFQFLLHDLEHAHKFFGDPKSFKGQVRFFQLLRESIPSLIEFCRPYDITSQLHYLMADMNSHPVHLFKYLKATVLVAKKATRNHVHIDLADFWIELLTEKWEMGTATVQAALRINEPSLETERDRETLFAHFLSSTC